MSKIAIPKIDPLLYQEHVRNEAQTQINKNRYLGRLSPMDHFQLAEGFAFLENIFIGRGNPFEDMIKTLFEKYGALNPVRHQKGQPVSWYGELVRRDQPRNFRLIQPAEDLDGHELPDAFGLYIRFNVPEV